MVNVYFGYCLLMFVIREGVVDFIVEKVVGYYINVYIFKYGEVNEEDFWKEFE